MVAEASKLKVRVPADKVEKFKVATVSGLEGMKPFDPPDMEYERPISTVVVDASDVTRRTLKAQLSGSEMLFWMLELVRLTA